jgi:hypothetical protein
MQDKLIAMDDHLIEDLDEDHGITEVPASDIKSVPVIEITRFDDNDLPLDTRVLPLQRFL